MSQPVLLLLVWLMSLHSAVAQYAEKGGCCDHLQPKKRPEPDMLKLYKQKVKTYVECPHSRVQLKFPNRNVCASKHDEWVQELICHIKKDSTDSFCAKYKDPASGPDYSKGSEQAPPTIPPARAESITESNSKQAPGVVVTQPVSIVTSHRPTSGKEEAPTEYAAVPSDNEAAPSEYPVVNQEGEDSERLEDSKWKDRKEAGITSSTRTAIISLVFISLFLMALVAFLICRTRKRQESHTELEKMGLSSSEE
ncbi:C-X-C motif chemokine 16 [Xenopus laevis]|uniref:C-X-C motif chemokine 16 n=2 Tax=Xenopus laevis TaxID=8355 RepID=A0A1L8H354_XENLA|nr:C-X-C motif chemokine 16 [Xenopus laevis]XP_018109228.1 C-X-C motif chemokine 16 [Xenopus laevis]OCT90523.1 hypothetical protein XELAEV_18019138mg [Xenopus laevis]